MSGHDLSMMALRDAVAARRVSAEEAVRAAVERAEGLNPALNAFLEIRGERAVEEARAIDRRLASGDAVGPLAGVPVALKDNICMDTGRTTCASRMLEGYESPFTSTAAQRLIDAGAVVIGKTNMDEFAMGSSTENSAFGPTRNPWDAQRVPGGSSGGSAAAVAAGIVPVALGSDTGGSVRQPAAFCGVVGVKPSYGVVSRWGLVAYASSLDQIGPLARTVEDAAEVLRVIAGRDAQDSTSVALHQPDLTGALQEPVEGLRIGVPRGVMTSDNHPAVNESMQRVIARLEGVGATVVEVDLATLSHAVPSYYLVACAEASSNLARFDGVRYGRRAAMRAGDDLEALYARSRAEGFGPEVQMRIMLGTFALSAGYADAYYLTALRVRRLIRNDLDRVFSGNGDRPACHAVLMPTTPGPAFRLGEKTSDPWAMYLEDIYTVTANLAGVCAASVPAGWAREGGLERGRRLPVGVQVLCPAYQDALMLRIARMIESDDARGVPEMGGV